MKLSGRCVLLSVVACLGSGCSKPDAVEKKVDVAPSVPATPPPVLVDGSSTVGPISRAVLDLYASRLVTDVKLEVSGTGGGFKKFCRKEIAASGASRPISTTEAKLCATNGVEFVELPIAFDGVAVVVPKANDWVEALSVEELKKIWQPSAEGSVRTWKDVNPKYPAEALVLAGPGIDSGTFDFFTQAIVGREGESRADYAASEKDAEIADRVASAPGGLGYFGLGHAVRNAERLRVVPIDDGIEENGKGPVTPARETISEGSYQPLGRPIFLYVSVAEAKRKEVAEFVQFYLRAARLVAPDVGYVPLPKRVFELAEARFEKRIVGTVFPEERSLVGVTIGDLLEAETVAVQESGAKAALREEPEKP